MVTVFVISVKRIEKSLLHAHLSDCLVEGQTSPRAPASG